MKSCKISSIQQDHGHHLGRACAFARSCACLNAFGDSGSTVGGTKRRLHVCALRTSRTWDPHCTVEGGGYCPAAVGICATAREKSQGRKSCKTHPFHIAPGPATTSALHHPSVDGDCNLSQLSKALRVVNRSRFPGNVSESFRPLSTGPMGKDYLSGSPRLASSFKPGRIPLVPEGVRFRNYVTKPNSTWATCAPFPLELRERHQEERGIVPDSILKWRVTQEWDELAALPEVTCRKANLQGVLEHCQGGQSWRMGLSNRGYCGSAEVLLQNASRATHGRRNK